MNQTRNNILRVLFCITLIIVLDWGIGKLLCHYYYKQKSGQESCINYVFSECKSDILVLGSSRAQYHINPRIISNQLKMTCYNGAIGGGQSILMQYAQVKVVTKRYKPQLIVFEFNPENIAFEKENYDKLSYLLPYYNQYAEVRPIVLLRDNYDEIKLLSAIYPFNSSIFNIIKNNTYATKKDIDGYVPAKNVMPIDSYKEEDTLAPHYIIDTNMVNALKGIISICKNKQIPLLIVNSPIFHKVNEKPKQLSNAGKLAIQLMRINQVNYWDFSNDTAYTGHWQWFKDKYHLNDEGAQRFSVELGKRIKTDLLQH